MVLPYEICHATYARPVLAHLTASFGHVRLVTFQKRLFPDLSESTVLLLASDRGGRCAEIAWLDLEDMNSLESQYIELIGAPSTNSASFRVSGSRERFVEQMLPERARDLYRQLRTAVTCLGALTEIGIGYVSGCNEFFHLSRGEATRRSIPEELLAPAVLRSKAFRGAGFTCADWVQAERAGDAAYLLRIPTSEDLPRSVFDYLREGEAKQIHERYKCRVREPWYRVPYVHIPDAFVTYMTGGRVQFVANNASAVAPNNLHTVRLLPVPTIRASDIAASWQSSLTRLSCEVEGHALGGGMLKLEPTEAKRVLVAMPMGSNRQAACEQIDEMLRRSDVDGARWHTDDLFLRNGLGLTDADCRLLNEGADLLAARRTGKAGSR